MLRDAGKGIDKMVDPFKWGEDTSIQDMLVSTLCLFAPSLKKHVDVCPRRKLIYWLPGLPVLQLLPGGMRNYPQHIGMSQSKTGDPAHQETVEFWEEDVTL